MIVLGDTDADAQRKVDLYAQGADIEAIDFLTSQYALDTAKDGSSAAIVARRNAGGRVSPFYGGGTPLAGSAETVARRLDEMAQVPGTDGIMLTFDDFVEGLDRFGDEVMPLLHHVGKADYALTGSGLTVASAS